jgi:hypothetical protein
MSLEIIGAGFGRTGTLSIRKALSDLGYPCYHMFDVLFDPRRKADIDFWTEVADAPDAPHDWERVFGGLRATVDFPACAVWRQLVRDHPEAKVLLTLHARGARAWAESTRGTIYVGTGMEAGTAFARKVNDVMDRLVWHGMLGGAMDDGDAAARAYEAHIEEVRDTVPASRLLLFSADQGWGPLCAFLGQPVPDRPFPNINNRDEMGRIMARLERLRSFGLRSGAA